MYTSIFKLVVSKIISIRKRIGRLKNLFYKFMENCLSDKYLNLAIQKKDIA